jgi:hypothetical protein
MTRSTGSSSACPAPAVSRFLPWNDSPENLRTWAQPPPNGETQGPGKVVFIQLEVA